MPLTLSDIQFILESLKWSKRRFGSYDAYPSEEYRRQRMAEVDEVVQRVRELRDELKGASRV